MIRLIFIAFSIATMGTFSVSNLKVEKKEMKSELTINSNLLAINFCGEKVPLTEMRIAERYQNTIRNYDTDSFRKLMTSAQKRMQIIEPILKKYGVPSDFKYIPIIESAMSNQATSHRGAGGYWQLMPATAKSLGLTVNGTVDDRKHLVKSTHAAGKYLKGLHRRLGSWTLVAAAYNAGPKHIKSRMNSQNNDDYFKLRLNAETTKYIYKLIAVKEWFSNPERSKEWGSGDVLDKMVQIREEKKLSQLNSDSKQLARAATDS